MYRSKQFRVIAVAAIAVGTLVVASCGSSGVGSSEPEGSNQGDAQGSATGEAPSDSVTDPESSGSSDSSEGDGPKHGGDLVIALNSDATDLNPWTATASPSHQFLNLMYDHLFERDWATGEIVPGIVEDIVYDWDAMQVDLIVRSGVHFSDGSELTADDVAYSLGQAMDESSHWATELLAVDSLTVEDSTTVRMHMNAVDGLVQQVMTNIFVGPKDSVETLAASPNGSGAFVMTNWSPNNEATFVRKDDYWRTGLPYVDSVTIKIVPDVQTAMLQLQSGQVDIVNEVDYSLVAEFEGESNIVFHWRDADSRGQVFDLWLNTRVAPLDDARVRTAINAALDRDNFKTLLGDAYQQFSNPLPPGSPNINPDVPSFDHQDLELARSLLGAAGFDTIDGLSIAYIGDYPDRAVLASAIQQDLAKAGINIDLAPMDTATWAESVFTTFDYDIAIEVVLPEANDFSILARTFGAVHGPPTGYEHLDDFEALMDQVRGSASDEETRGLLNQAQEMIFNDNWLIALGGRSIPMATSPQVKDLVVNSKLMTLPTAIWLD